MRRRRRARRPRPRPTRLRQPQQRLLRRRTPQRLPRLLQLPPAAVAAVPAEEDYEPQAEAAITTSNATQQLAAIEKEIGK